jgi:hypothetical protein
MSDDKYEKHPSYGMVQFSRVQCGGMTLQNKLFGSPLPYHLSTVRLRIMRGERHHNLSYDSFYGHEEIIEVELSPQQFADLLTSMNIGSGVPCTIRHLNGKQVEEPPHDSKSEAELVRDGFDDDVKKIATDLKVQSAAIKERLGKKNLTVEDRKFIASTLDMLVQEVEKNLPFVLQQFVEATTRVVTSAKAEADAFLSAAIQRVGLDTLKEHLPDFVKKMLPAKVEEP